MACHTSDPSTAEQPASTRSADVAAYFTGLHPDVLAQRGRIMAEITAPFFITSCDGAAAKILGSQGSSRLTGRRLRGIAHRSCDVANLEAASRACSSPHHRAFLRIATEDGRCVPVVVQLGEGSTDDLQLEILLFPAPECHHLLTKDFIIDMLESRANRAHLCRRKSPDKDLELVKGDNRDGFRALDYDWLDVSIVKAKNTSAYDSAALHLESDLQL